MVLSRLGLSDSLPLHLPDNDLDLMAFSISSSEKIYLADHREPNGAYIENTLTQAVTLYDCLLCRPSLLRIDCLPSEGEPCLFSPSLLRQLHLPAPEEIRRPDQKSGGAAPESLYWQIPEDTEFLRNLFREIIRCELSPRGIEALYDSVYLAAEEPPLLYHLADDRSVSILLRNIPARESFIRKCAGFSPLKKRLS